LGHSKEVQFVIRSSANSPVSPEHNRFEIRTQAYRHLLLVLIRQTAVVAPPHPKAKNC